MRAFVALSLVSALAAGAGAFAYVEIGGKLPNPQLAQLSGGQRPFLSTGKTTLFVFFDPAQEHSRELLRELGELQAERRAENRDGAVEWVGLISDRLGADAAREAAAQSGIRLETLVDAGDKLYGELGVRLYPSVGIADGTQTLLAYLPFEKVNYQATIRAWLQRCLGEISEAQLQEVLHPAAVKIDGDLAQAERNAKLAGMLLDAGKPEAALEAAKRALAAAPDLAAAHAVVGAVAAAKGDCATARPSLQRALALDAGNARANEALARCP